MEFIREHFHAIIFHNFRRGLSRQECIDELKFVYDVEALWKTVLWKTDLINSILADVRSKARSMKVVQKQPFCQRTLNPCVSW